MRITSLGKEAAKYERKLCLATRRIPALKKLGPKVVSWFFEVSLVSDSEIQKLNKKYRRKNKPTDVLSFPASSEFFKLGHLGELIIAEGVLKKQAREFKHSATVELKILMAHGFLHLLGLDHELSEKHSSAMAKWEEKLLGRSGIPLTKRNSV
ncbi:MAG: rRNA maturation RNase YbeY [Xanthomonadaceae bacterium]|nr:rRNA maturation RNase YbeY [Xanthomonadaceae bacterium]